MRSVLLSAFPIVDRNHCKHLVVVGVVSGKNSVAQAAPGYRHSDAHRFGTRALLGVGTGTASFGDGFARQEYDTGAVLRRETVHLCRGDSLDDACAARQSRHAAGCHSFLEELAAGTHTPGPTRRADGWHFRCVGARRPETIIRLLNEARYLHYSHG
jgi:hypothetical protein